MLEKAGIVGIWARTVKAFIEEAEATLVLRDEQWGNTAGLGSGPRQVSKAGGSRAREREDGEVVSGLVKRVRILP